MVSTSKQCAKKPFTGQNAQQLPIASLEKVALRLADVEEG